MVLVEQGTLHRVAGIDVRAVSVGGMETCIELPSWKLAFDIGRCPPSAVRAPRILFTHAHVDHMGGVAHHASLRDLWGMSAPEYVVPTEVLEPFEALLSAWRTLARSKLPCSVRAVHPGEVLDLGSGREARVFRSVHRAPTVGYALVRRKRVLKEAWRGKAGAVIAQARRAGEHVTEQVPEVEVAFCGDTTAAVLDREPLLHTARLLILECTFLDDRVSVAKARRTGHVHLDELIARAHLLANDAILLTHFSARYAPSEIPRILDRRLPRDLRERVVPLLPGDPWVKRAAPATRS